MEIGSASHAISSFYSPRLTAGKHTSDNVSHQHLGATSDQGNANTAGSKKELSDEEQQVVRQLKARDREVRAHEQAHKSAAGNLAQGGASFEYTKGPDGKQYATGGEVKIDTSKEEGDPEATLRKAQQIQRAAMAPAEPSAQDMQVAAMAVSMQVEARIEKSKLEKEEAEKDEQEESKPAATRSYATQDPLESASSNAADTQTNADSVVCSICGGKHTGESHSDSNAEKLNAVIRQTQEATESLLQLAV